MSLVYILHTVVIELCKDKYFSVRIIFCRQWHCFSDFWIIYFTCTGASSYEGAQKPLYFFFEGSIDGVMKDKRCDKHICMALFYWIAMNVQ